MPKVGQCISSLWGYPDDFLVSAIPDDDNSSGEDIVKFREEISQRQRKVAQAWQLFSRIVLPQMPPAVLTGTRDMVDIMKGGDGSSIGKIITKKIEWQFSCEKAHIADKDIFALDNKDLYAMASISTPRCDAEVLYLHLAASEFSVDTNVSTLVCRALDNAKMLSNGAQSAKLVPIGIKLFQNHANGVRMSLSGTKIDMSTKAPSIFVYLGLGTLFSSEITTAKTSPIDKSVGSNWGDWKDWIASRNAVTTNAIVSAPGGSIIGGMICFEVLEDICVNENVRVDEHLRSSPLLPPLPPWPRYRSVDRGPRIERPISSYMFYVKAARPKIVAANPGLDFSAIGMLVGSIWKKLSTEEKMPYTKMAEQDKDRYMKNKLEESNRELLANEMIIMREKETSWSHLMSVIHCLARGHAFGLNKKATKSASPVPKFGVLVKKQQPSMAISLKKWFDCHLLDTGIASSIEIKTVQLCDNNFDVECDEEVDIRESGADRLHIPFYSFLPMNQEPPTKQYTIEVKVEAEAEAKTESRRQNKRQKKDCDYVFDECVAIIVTLFRFDVWLIDQFPKMSSDQIRPCISIMTGYLPALATWLSRSPIKYI